jgi:hypothetical protein
MTKSDIAKNILLDRTCDTCSAQKVTDSGIKTCRRWLGEACGLQWWPRPDENTCEDWKK